MSGWLPLPVGSFTGIDWADPDQASGLDPYLAWAEADRFAGYGYKDGAQPEMLPLIIELRPGRTIDELMNASTDTLLVPTAYGQRPRALRALRYCTALASRGFFESFRKKPMSDIVSRFELGLPAGSHGCGYGKGTGRSEPAADPVERLPGPIMAFIDGGLAFANDRFLREGKSRTKFLWRQDRRGVGPRPGGFDYGHEITASCIDREIDRCRSDGLVDEEAVYAHFHLHDLQRQVNHGTHVADIACGPRTVAAQFTRGDAPPQWQAAGDTASSADIVAVQLDWNTVLDTSGGSMNVHILDGLMYILSRCEDDARVSVNISWGTLAGPHDGSSVLEAAMDDLLALKGGLLSIAVPAGNSYQSRTHANDRLLPRRQAGRHAQILNWCVQPDDRTQTFLEVWIAGAVDAFDKATLTLTPPGCASFAPVPLGESRMWARGENEPPACAVIFPKRVATGTCGACALIALAPTSSFEAEVVTAPAGTWRVEISNEGSDPIVFDAYIERDDIPIGVPGLGGRQPYFTDDHYDTSGGLDGFVDDPANPTPIRRTGNFNSISTGRLAVSVGGVRFSDGSPAWYSPRKHDPGVERPKRPGVRIEPKREALSDEDAAIPGLPAAGSTTAAVVRLVGTSSATPQVARALIDE